MPVATTIRKVLVTSSPARTMRRATRFLPTYTPWLRRSPCTRGEP